MVHPAPDPQALKRKIGGYSRQGNKVAAEATRLELAEANLTTYILRVVGEAPELSAEQRDRIASLLKSA